MGATFALYTLFRDPHLFHRYVIASSSPNFDDEANYAREHDRLPIRLHFVMEESDPEVATLQRFLDTLTSRAYAGLKVSHQVPVAQLGRSRKPRDSRALPSLSAL